MLVARNLLICLIVGFTVIGCKSAVTSAETTGSEGAATGGAGAVAGAARAPSASGTRVENINDPSLNMTAVAVTVPASWHFKGTLMQGSNCIPTPFAVFRVTSPDGLSAMEAEPTLGWQWGTGPVATQAQKAQSDCLPLKSALGAQQYLKYLAATMGVQYISDEPEPAAENATAQAGLQSAEASVAGKYAAAHLTPPKTTRELARALVSFQNGTFAMKGELRVFVDCTQTNYPGMKSILRGIPDRPSSTVNHCAASTRYYTAPAAQLASVLSLWDTPGMGGAGQMPWEQAWVERNQQQANQAMAQIRANTNAAMAASHAQFEQSMAVQNQMHQQFMATMQRGTDMSMANANASMNARSTATSDWVNYALDQQTVADPNTGQLSNVSSSYGNTWVDSSGKTSYQTNDVNANPNGVLPGTWTKQTVVHGNGTPK
jgi:hypothetical protein